MAGGSGKNSTGASNQAGILEGMNPSHYNPNDPLTLFIIQVGFHSFQRLNFGRNVASEDKSIAGSPFF